VGHRRNAADLFCECLSSLGVEVVFGVPGTQSLALYDAMRRARFRTLTACSEAGALWMANGYYRASGRPGVGVTIGGPGFALGLPGLAEARSDSAALLHVVCTAEKKSGRSFQFQELDINQPVENALMLTGQQLLNHKIAITKKLSEGLPKIRGDSNQLEQVFLNLISNAKDAMETVSGPKELTIHSYLSDQDEFPTVAVSLKDTGEGIPEEILTKVLEPFFTTKQVGRGTGLGLSVVYGIIRQHGGMVHVYSEPGRGTRRPFRNGGKNVGPI